MPISTMERIEQLRGLDELKALARRLQRVAENKRALPMTRVQLPNYLFIEAPGCGVTTHIRLITDLLYELKLIPFEGERRSFEWVLDENAFAPGGGFDRLLDQLALMAGFHSRFKGVVGLEIDLWQYGAMSPALTRLLDLADDMLGQVLFIFVVQLDPDYAPDDLIRRLSAEMPLEVVRCPLPATDDMAFYLCDFLRDRRLRVSLPAAEGLKALLPRLSALEAFDGFQTLDNLADEIVYRFFAAPVRRESGLIEAEDIAFITEPGGYIDRLAQKKRVRARRAIGFQTGVDDHEQL